MKRWTDDTPDRLQASLAREGVDAETRAVLDAFIAGTGPDPQRRKQVPKRVGRRANRPPGIPVMKSTVRRSPEEQKEAWEAASETREDRSELRRLMRRITWLERNNPGGAEIEQCRTQLAVVRARFAERGLPDA